jgi:hypothetical protein
VPVDLKRGTNLLQFFVPEGCDRPSDIAELNNSDTRCLSVGIENPVIFERKDSNICSGGGQLSAIFASGWHNPESWNTITTLWMQADAEVTVCSEESREATMVFQAMSFARPRSLEISADASPPANFSVAASFVNITWPIRLTRGQNLIRLHVPDGCEKPCNFPELNSSDCRCISMAVQKLRVK